MKRLVFIYDFIFNKYPWREAKKTNGIQNYHVPNEKKDYEV